MWPSSLLRFSSFLLPFIPVIHFFGLNDTGSLFALEWWMHFPDEGAGGKCNKEFLRVFSLNARGVPNKSQLTEISCAPKVSTL